MKLSEIVVGDLIQTFDNEIGVVTKVFNKGLYLSTIDEDKLIYIKDIKKIRYIISMCLKHRKRNCEICNKISDENYKNYFVEKI